ncbi:MAG: aminotransferase [Gammaproteobacteria bacterium]
MDSSTPDASDGQATPAKDIAHLIHPYTDLDVHADRGPVVIERGEGPYVFDSEGKRYLEGMAALWCVSLGFSEPRLVEAAERQLRTLPYYHVFNHRSHPQAIELAARLTAIAPPGLNQVLFANSGSEANDSAIKLAWYYNNALGRPKKKKIVSRWGAYHGVTIGAGSLTGVPAMHVDFDLPIANVIHAEQPSWYHGARPGESREAFGTRMVAQFEALIEREGGDTIAAFIAEPVIGSGGGVVIPPPGYFDGIQALLRKHDILLIADEVMTGFGRTGRMWGSEHFGLKPDMMTVAKALSSAYMPISGLLLTDAIHDAMKTESRKVGFFAHGVTYSAHPVCAAVANETLKIYEERDIVGHVQRIAPRFMERLRRFEDHALVGETRGIGLLGAIEITRDKTTREGFELTSGIGPFLQGRAMEHGVIVRAIRNCVAVCPPLIVNEAQIDELFDGLEKALDETLAWARQQGLV